MIIIPFSLTAVPSVLTINMLDLNEDALHYHIVSPVLEEAVRAGEHELSRLKDFFCHKKG